MFFQVPIMYTNTEMNILNRVREHLEKGDIDLEFYFAERTFDKTLLNEILGSLCEVSLPENLNLILNLNSSNVEDDLVEHLATKLSEINWPNKFKLELLLRNNSTDNKAANVLFDLLKKFDKFPEAEVVIDLDNNNILDSSVIDDALEKIKSSALNGDAVISKDNSKTIKFCKYLIRDYLSPDHESDDS